MLRITLVPESKFDAKNFHYIILIDRSYSMKGEKLDMAKEGARLLIENLPKDSYFSLLTFNEKIDIIKEHVHPSPVNLDQVKVGSGTAMYKALQEAFSLASKYNQPTFAILLTDGEPSDMGCMPGLSRKFNLAKCLPVYQGLTVPENVQIISFGLGEEYSEAILTEVSEKGRGFFYHVTDPSEIPDKMPKLAKSQIAASNVVVDLISESPVKLLNYSELPVRINAVEGVVKIYGETVIPRGYEGKFITLKLNYDDENGRQNKVIEFSLKRAQSQQDFVSGLNRDLLMEYEYLRTLQDYSRDVEANNLVEATKKLDRLKEIAEQTRRQDLQETALELTRKMSSGEGSKEIASEVTRKMRSQE
ncbi:VWA domain-containing protein [Metallosphaera hakonensis JCM 8857 = DSM 7519]|uniref:VWA domain-containing protein n=1 Tax=Metallosphaera hakonensis JCM 8857 = DSM 7519 TaxID=1293036 RepID=A0A2U9IXT4_9CREN|nr:VWA domain-containing protein [Metallosphaera hakonensis JCM 8857 = DSM 7519]